MARVEIPEHPPGMTARALANQQRYKKMTPRENTEISLSGMAHAWGSGELATLGGLAVVSAILDEMIRAEVAEAREAGYSWSEIGAALGTTKQAAQQKYRNGRRV